MKVSWALSTTTSVSLALITSITTNVPAAGGVLSTTVNESVPPASVVSSPVVGVTVTAKVLSMLITVTSGGSTLS